MTSDRDERPKIPAPRMDTDTVPLNSETFGLTQRMAASSSRHPRRTLAIWGLLVLVALLLVGTVANG